MPYQMKYFVWDEAFNIDINDTVFVVARNVEEEEEILLAITGLRDEGNFPDNFPPCDKKDEDRDGFKCLKDYVEDSALLGPYFDYECIFKELPEEKRKGIRPVSFDLELAPYLDRLDLVEIDFAMLDFAHDYGQAINLKEILTRAAENKGNDEEPEFVPEPGWQELVFQIDRADTYTYQGEKIFFARARVNDLENSELTSDIIMVEFQKPEDMPDATFLRHLKKHNHLDIRCQGEFIAAEDGSLGDDIRFDAHKFEPAHDYDIDLSISKDEWVRDYQEEVKFMIKEQALLTFEGIS